MTETQTRRKKAEPVTDAEKPLTTDAAPPREIVEATNGKAQPPAADESPRALVEAPVAPVRALVNWASMRNMTEAIAVAELVAKSNAFPKIRNAGQALLVMMAGQEMGFSPFASLAGVHMIEGVPAVGAHLKAAAIKQSGRYDYEIQTPQGQERTRCDLEFFKIVGGKRQSIPGGKISVILDEVAPSLRGKANWKNHPDDMLFATAINKGYRRACPDLTGGVLSYDPDEIEAGGNLLPQGSASPASDVVDASYTITEPGKAPVHVVDVKEKEVASEHLIGRIDELIRQGQFPMARIQTLLDYFKVTTFRQLTPNQAAKVIRKLEKAEAEAVAEGA